MFLQWYHSPITNEIVYFNNGVLNVNNTIIKQSEHYKCLSYHHNLKQHNSPNNIIYADLMFEGDDPLSCCHFDIKRNYHNSLAKLKANSLACLEAGIGPTANTSIIELIPEKVFVDYFVSLNKITDYLLTEKFLSYNSERYDYLFNLIKTVNNIKYRQILVDGKLKTIAYKAPGTKTGRLTTLPGSFPILTINRKYRNQIKPSNDFFVEFDYNAAEFRVLLALQGLQTDHISDIHSYHQQLLNSSDRKEAKKRAISWLYDTGNFNKALMGIYDRDIWKSYISATSFGSAIKTPIGKIIELEEGKELNYLIQSTTGELILQQASKIDQFLEEKKLKSYLAFIMHDAVVIDLSLKDFQYLKTIKELFTRTMLDNFVTSIKYGKDYGSMQLVN